MKLFMVLLGGKPKGRLTEQHDVFFGIGESLSGLLVQLQEFWPGVQLHIDSWREVTAVDGYRIAVVPKSKAVTPRHQLFFFNLGGYKENDLEEYHYKLLAVADTLAQATQKAKDTAFYKHFGFKGAVSHIDDKYGIDVDDAYKVEDILNDSIKMQYTIAVTPAETATVEDQLHIGYLSLAKLT